MLKAENMMRQIILPLITISLFTVVVSCGKQSEYQQLVKQQYQKGAENNRLFLGYRFGMTRNQFFDHSRKLNQQKLVRQGEGNRSVLYSFNGLKSRAKMNFYPTFHRDSIYTMPVQYAYTGWAPWNRKLWADSLEKDLLTFFQNKYAYDFKRMQHPEKKKPAYIAIEGNKRISIFQMGDDQRVAVVYTDLDVLNQINGESND